ncbi:MurR/RpiR family transcriptional regulator [Streptococcus parauberis]|uniref:MurR/RpiR family transcriptional regulator n=1 Tax=Streptococcus parauberis TaxID=1348 RepID=UPI000CCF5730|nr:MurR/RpiR family transcriptional regulator [Streptococcus parauberis]PNY20368.1 HTH-type transcriptional regulator GlvR [Streptococcus parauberis]
MSLKELVQKTKTPLTENDWLIFDYLEQEASPWLLTIQDISLACHVSTTTIFRFCQKLGLNGFSQLRVLLKHSRDDKNLVSRKHFQEIYHQVVDYIANFDSKSLLEHIKSADTIFIFARTELELRLAKDFQRIFFPLGKVQVILPSNQALLSSQSKMINQILWVLQIDSTDEFPVELQSVSWLNHIYLVLLSDFRNAQVLADERLYVPSISTRGGETVSHITPYTLAVEMLYLKLQLT